MRIYGIFLVLLMVLNNEKGAEVTPRPGKDHALFFAIDDYAGTPSFSSLKNPGKDADALAGELKAMYGFETEVHKNLTKTQIFQVLERWQKKKFAEDAQLFIFFSGHGTFWEFTKKGYFVPKGSPNDYSAYIELTDLGNIVTQIPCKHILLAIDACYSGTIDQAIAFKGDAPTFRRPGDVATSERDNLIYRQLRNPSRLLLTSGGKERTPDGANNSPFAAAVLKGLRGAYTYGDGLFTYADLLSALERVSPTPHQGELPGHESGGFVFISQSQAAPTTSAATQPPRMVEPQKPTIPDDFVLVKGGTFQMGDQFGDGNENEEPVHSVTVSDFYMGKYEVTVGEFKQFIDASRYETIAEKDEGSYIWNDSTWEKKAGINWRHDASGKLRPGNEYNHPVLHVSWYDAIKYCNWRSKQEGLQAVYDINSANIKLMVTCNWAANGYRLPTEAEWEYAARSRGKKEKWAGISVESDLAIYANYSESDSKDKNQYTAPVGTYSANVLGLYDMSGNVWEWCWDCYSDKYYGESNNIRDPRGPTSSTDNHVVRGGSWFNNPDYCRAFFRGWSWRLRRDGNMGFRLVRH